VEALHLPITIRVVLASHDWCGGVERGDVHVLYVLRAYSAMCRRAATLPYQGAMIFSNLAKKEHFC
jgi:hypothetical protein